MVIYAAFLRALPTIQTIQYYQLLLIPTLLIMHLTELKNTPVSDLVKLGEEQMGLENLARLRKQDIVFAILKQHAKSGEDIFWRRRVGDFTRWFRFLTLRRQFLPCWS